MRYAEVIAVAVLLAGCGRGPGAPVKAYRYWQDRFIVGLGLADLGVVMPCTNSNGADECFRMEQPKRWQGLLWSDGLFCPDTNTKCTGESREPMMLEWNRKVFKHSPPVPALGANSYEVEFVGRRTATSIDETGKYYRIVVDRLISVKRFEIDPELAEMQIAPEAFVRRQDQEAMRRLNAGLKAPYPCEDLERQPMDRCYRFGAQQHWQGEWKLEMESSTFCPAPSRNCPKDYQGKLWLEFRKGVEPREEKYPPGGTFAIEFVGRKNLLPGTFGYAGMFENEVIVDRVISMKKVED
jgi:hypothetical protein